MHFQTITRRAVLPIAAGAVIGTGLTACGSAGRSPSPSPAPATPTTSAAPAATLRLSAGQQQFVADMRGAFSFGSGVSARGLATFGQRVRSDRRSGASVAAEVPDAHRTWANTSKGHAIQMIMLAERYLCPDQSTRQTVTYVATGSGANVTYGPSGSGFQGTAPMTVTRQLGQPQSYTISAQLTGGSSATCELRVDGVTLASASASGAGNVASCEIDQDIDGSWVNNPSG